MRPGSASHRYLPFSHTPAWRAFTWRFLLTTRWTCQRSCRARITCVKQVTFSAAAHARESYEAEDGEEEADDCEEGAAVLYADERDVPVLAEREEAEREQEQPEQANQQHQSAHDVHKSLRVLKLSVGVVETNLHAAKGSAVFVREFEPRRLVPVFIAAVLAQSYLQAQRQLHLVARLSQRLDGFSDLVRALDGRVDGLAELLHDLLCVVVYLQSPSLGDRGMNVRGISLTD